MNTAQKFAELFKVYGPAVIVSQIGVCGLWYGTVFAGVRSGLDYKALAAKVGIDPENEKLKTASDAAIAYVIYKAMAPIRIPVTIAIIPFVAKLFRIVPK
ncbi:hypothetical protein ABPG74_013256 [Tetrahymena malaccensis]